MEGNENVQGTIILWCIWMHIRGGNLCEIACLHGPVKHGGLSVVRHPT